MNIGADWADALAHEAREYSHGPGYNWAAQHEAEMKWINTSNFDFALKMRTAYMQYGSLTEGQLAAVRRCMNFGKTAMREETRHQPVPFGPDLRHIPAGMYAVPAGTSRLKVKIAKPTEGKWTGFIFVSDGAVYGQQQRYGMQRPGALCYQGQIVEQLKAIAADPQAAMAEYGRMTGHCGICGRPLEDETSVARGIGPICAGRMGW